MKVLSFLFLEDSCACIRALYDVAVSIYTLHSVFVLGVCIPVV